MEENYIKIEIKPVIENISPARLCITSFLGNMDIHLDELMDIKTALSEAITNAVDHAYDSPTLLDKIDIETRVLKDNKVRITIKDYGKGIEDISLAMTPAYTSKPENEHAGMGFTIMESFMDEVIVDSIVDKGTTIILTKNIRKRKTNKS